MLPGVTGTRGDGTMRQVAVLAAAAALAGCGGGGQKADNAGNVTAEVPAGITAAKIADARRFPGDRCLPILDRKIVADVMGSAVTKAEVSTATAPTTDTAGFSNAPTRWPTGSTPQGDHSRAGRLTPTRAARRIARRRSPRPSTSRRSRLPALRSRRPGGSAAQPARHLPTGRSTSYFTCISPREIRAERGAGERPGHDRRSAKRAGC